MRSEYADDLARLRAELTDSPHRIGEGNVTFTRLDGFTVTIENVRVDSVSPVGAPGGVVAVEFFDSDRVVHVPFVQSWEFDYLV